TLPGQAFQFAHGDSATFRLHGLKADSLFVRGEAGRLLEFATPGGVFEFGDRPGNIITSGYMLGWQAFGGAGLVNLDGKLREYFGSRDGVLVISVPKGTPAERAGLQEGDVVTRVNGTAVTSIRELRAAVD